MAPAKILDRPAQSALFSGGADGRSILGPPRAATFEGLSVFRLSVSGKSVLLKPNLIEDLPGPVSANPILVGAAARCFLRMGARRVVVADGPGHQRDTELVVRSTGLEQQLAELGIEFVDLNRDEVRKVKLRAYSGLCESWLPRAVRASGFIVSMPKIKTHHWAGVTLSLKNMFGVVPGIKYGWPKNPLHWHGIHESILDICATVPIHYVIADGIQAIEGNGPLHGTVRQLNRIVLADDPVAADATCARLMGFEPGRVRHIAEASRFLGNQGPARSDNSAIVCRRQAVLLQGSSRADFHATAITRVRTNRKRRNSTRTISFAEALWMGVK